MLQMVKKRNKRNLYDSYSVDLVSFETKLNMAELSLQWQKHTTCLILNHFFFESEDRKEKLLVHKENLLFVIGIGILNLHSEKLSGP